MRWVVQATTYSAYAPCVCEDRISLGGKLHMKQHRVTYPPSQTKDVVADRPFCDFASNLGDYARELDAKDRRCTGRRRVLALSLTYVHAVEAESLNLVASVSDIPDWAVSCEGTTHLNENLSRGDLWLWDFADVKVLSWSGSIFDEDCAHHGGLWGKGIPWIAAE